MSEKLAGWYNLCVHSLFVEGNDNALVIFRSEQAKASARKYVQQQFWENIYVYQPQFLEFLWGIEKDWFYLLS